MKTQHPYQDPGNPVETRIDDLMQRMTLEEKVGQLMQVNGQDREEALEKLDSQHAGSFLQVRWDWLADFIERAGETRLGIPLILGNDCIHGFSFWKDATILPTQLAAACSWNTDLIEQGARITAEEMVQSGCSWTFSPVLCITRDLRWGRVGETFGEDPYLIGEFGAAMIRGYQGEDLSAVNSVLACAKHYAGYSETLGGRDASEAELSRRKLKSFFLPPFQRAVEAGVGTFMTGYQAIDGQPSTANRWLLRETLKDEWGFDGFMVTDWNNVGHMVENQKVCRDYAEAAKVSMEAGNDMIMTTPNFYEGCLDAVNSGQLDVKWVDDAVRRILRYKFKLGLFENPRMPDLAKVDERKQSPAHREVALQMARESAVLLENNGVLPLQAKQVKKIALIGPNADDHLAQLGDWSLGSGQAIKNSAHNKEAVVTLLDGIKTHFDGDVLYEKGCEILNDSTDGIAAAVEIAKQSDLAVVVLGDCNGLMGEWRSTATLDLQGPQLALLEAVRATGVKTVVVLVHSKPNILPAIVTEADAVVELFNPGIRGGDAFGEILTGKANPSGKLTVSVPRHIGQCPVFYNQVRGQHGENYADLTQTPMYAFGYGKSYNTYRYENARIKETQLGQQDHVEVSVEVTNEGQFPGIETVQAYISDLYTSATWPLKELKGYARVSIAPGATETVQIKIPVSACSLVNVAGERVVESGDFQCLVGSSSRNQDLVALDFSVK
ncbi:MAG TPA: beta-glucosidase [Opitutae bacterium]|nr:beta-glucosidase [Puniceicoccaceae bacterium]HBR93684.1 beta-glucosidase [Opitutae bacterium]